MTYQGLGTSSDVISINEEVDFSNKINLNFNQEQGIENNTAIPTNSIKLETESLSALELSSLNTSFEENRLDQRENEDLASNDLLAANTSTPNATSSTNLLTENFGWLGETEVAALPTICNCAACCGLVASNIQNSGQTASTSTFGPTYSLSSLPLLSSNPDATAKIYLDFSGGITSNTIWNHNYNNGFNIDTPAFSIDNDTTTFSSEELDAITEIWSRVAEDFAPFNVDVTTVDPGNFSATEGIRVAVGGSWDDWYGNSAGGVAYTGSWRWNSDTPVFVFEDNTNNGDAKYTAEAISHEIGHALGLQHQSVFNSQGILTEEYNTGDGNWAPIMGLGFESELTTWHNGTNQNGVYQDDIAIIAAANNGFGYRDDDHGNSRSTATALGGGANVTASGIIGSSSDADVFSFSTDAGAISFQVDVAEFGANLDAVAELRNSSGTLIASSSPSNQLSASINTSVAAGTYYLYVKSTGEYGRVGNYYVSGEINPLANTTPVEQETDVDLAGAYFNVNPEPLLAGEEFNVQFQVENSGVDNAGAFSVDFYLSDDSNITSSDYFLGSYTFNGLAGNSNSGLISTDLILPEGGNSIWNGDGNYHIGMIVDGDNAVIESSESNNSSTANLKDYDRVAISYTTISLPTISIADSSISEGNSGTTNAVFTLQLSHSSSQTIQLNYNTSNISAIAGDDYTAVSNSVSFTPGQTVAIITVPIYGDTIVEGDETFSVNLSNAQNATITDAQAIGTIENNDFSLYGTQGNDTSLRGNFGEDTIIGLRGSDQLDGRFGNDTLIGVDPESTLAGQGEVDYLTGGVGNDIFVLGDANQAYYNDGNDSNLGTSDYALIEDFNIFGDRIQLHGSADNYRLHSLASGTAILLETPQKYEGIALIAGVDNLSLTGDYFDFV